MVILELEEKILVSPLCDCNSPTSTERIVLISDVSASARVKSLGRFDANRFC